MQTLKVLEESQQLEVGNCQHGGNRLLQLQANPGEPRTYTAVLLKSDGVQPDAGLVPGFKSTHSFLHLESLTTKGRQKAAELSSGFRDTLVQTPSFLLGRTLLTDGQPRVLLYSNMQP